MKTLKAFLDSRKDLKKIIFDNKDVFYVFNRVIKKEFGEDAYTNNTLNRKYLASSVFNDAFQLEKLNAITHPAVIDAAQKWMQQQTTAYVIKDAALMFESASAAGVDLIIGVYAPQHIRIKRVMDRDGVTRQDVLARIDKQIEINILISESETIHKTK